MFKGLLFSLTALWICSSQAVEVINAGKDFKILMKNFNSSNLEENINSWNTLEEKYNEVYSTLIFPHNSPNWFQNKTSQLTYFFAMLPALSERMQTVFDNADDIANAQIQKFKSINPDFSTNIKVYFIPSALTFNGRVAALQASPSKYSLIVGVDGIFFWNNDIDVLFAHELFHMYHFGKASGANFESKIAAFWTEGLASYYTHKTMPDKSLSQILMDPELGKSCESSQYVSDLAKKLLAVAEAAMTPVEQNQFMREWFWMSGTTKPHRSGYCLGFRVAEALSKKHSLEEMVSWGDATFEEKFLSVLKDLAK